MKAYEQLYLLTLALGGSQWWSLRPGHFIYGVESPVSTKEEAGCTLEPIWTL